MCLITFAWKHHPNYQLILVANRDEFYERPTAPLGYWNDNPDILGGRDLKEGGTWMGMHRSGRMTAITNHRDLTNIKASAPSRGNLTKDFLAGSQSSPSFYEGVKGQLDLFNGFNLLTLENNELYYFNNIQKELLQVKPGIYGLSNAFLDTPWPKVQKAKRYFEATLKKDHPSATEMIEWMGDGELAPDEQLPATGVSADWEKQLSAMCIQTENYGTCCTTVITIDHGGGVEYTEKTYAVGNRRPGTVSVQFPT
ncbi:MAG: NRDE family protein [Imperialibacter sp.]|uniref:NRDE family protein n=1 Tax=Imperialibacter sp. TaxID=2038411 RepID=UPI0030DBF0D1|tara:strand:+ start:9425 stop:10186 length:762 start_codon:yes stop_codon:yes gene_type:complete